MRENGKIVKICIISFVFVFLVVGTIVANVEEKKHPYEGIIDKTNFYKAFSIKYEIKNFDGYATFSIEPKKDGYAVCKESSDVIKVNLHCGFWILKKEIKTWSKDIVLRKEEGYRLSGTFIFHESFKYEKASVYVEEADGCVYL